MNNKIVNKQIRAIWRESFKNFKYVRMEFYNDQRTYGRRIKCSASAFVESHPYCDKQTEAALAAIKKVIKNVPGYEAERHEEGFEVCIHIQE